MASESDAAVVREVRDFLHEIAAYSDDVEANEMDPADAWYAVADRLIPLADGLGPVLARMETAVAAPAPDRDEVFEIVWKLDNRRVAEGVYLTSQAALDDLAQRPAKLHTQMRVQSVRVFAPAGVGGVPAEPQAERKPRCDDRCPTIGASAPVILCAKPLGHSNAHRNGETTWWAGAVPQDREAGQ